MIACLNKKQNEHYYQTLNNVVHLTFADQFYKDPASLLFDKIKVLHHELPYSTIGTLADSFSHNASLGSSTVSSSYYFRLLCGTMRSLRLQQISDATRNKHIENNTSTFFEMILSQALFNNSNPLEFLTSLLIYDNINYEPTNNTCSLVEKMRQMYISSSRKVPSFLSKACQTDKSLKYTKFKDEEIKQLTHNIHNGSLYWPDSDVFMLLGEAVRSFPKTYREMLKKVNVEELLHDDVARRTFFYQLPHASFDSWYLSDKYLKERMNEYYNAELLVSYLTQNHKKHKTLSHYKFKELLHKCDINGKYAGLIFYLGCSFVDSFYSTKIINSFEMRKWSGIALPPEPSCQARSWEPTLNDIFEKIDPSYLEIMVDQDSSLVCYL